MWLWLTARDWARSLGLVDDDYLNERVNGYGAADFEVFDHGLEGFGVSGEAFDGDLTV